LGPVAVFGAGNFPFAFGQLGVGEHQVVFYKSELDNEPVREWLKSFQLDKEIFLMALMTIKDLENLQATLSEAGQDYQLELENGKIIVMGPSDIISSEIGVRLIAFLLAWVEPRRLGRIFDSAGGFIMPDTNLKAPDVSFVRESQLQQSVRYFAKLVPDLVVEIKSQSDRINPLKNKINKFLELGAQVGILIDPDELIVTVYRSTEEPVILGNGDILTLPELFLGWELPINELWPPVFTDDEF
jgi:Uma2 family endonuclease